MPEEHNNYLFMAGIMATPETQRNRIHPHKFTMWIAMGSIIMMFAGLTSAYIVKSNQPKWITFSMPVIFWYSTAILLLSSLTMQLALREFKDRNILKYRRMLILTLILGVLFVTVQIIGFNQIWNSGITLSGSGAAPFMYVIFGLHGLHVIGGVVALTIMMFKAFRTRKKSYDPVPVEVISTYWHFVDLLWLYLFIFFMAVQ